MSLNRNYLLIAAAVIALALAYFYTQVDWEARAIRKRLDQLIELVEKEGPVSKFEAVGRSRKLTGFFTENPSIEYVTGRRLPRDLDAMSGAFLSIFAGIETASVWVLRHEVEVDPAQSSAESNVVVRSSVVIGGSEQMGDTLKYRIYWLPTEGEWQIKEVIALGRQ